MSLCGVIWVENPKKESTSKLLMVCLSLGWGQARSGRHRNFVYLIRSRIICRFVNSDLICHTKGVPWMWSYMYTRVLWSQCWFKNFCPCITVHNLTLLIKGVVGGKWKNRFVLMVKNPGALHLQKFSAPNNEMRIKSQKHRIVEAWKSL